MLATNYGGLGGEKKKKRKEKEISIRLQQISEQPSLECVSRVFILLSTEMRINSEPLPCFIDAASREEPWKWELVAPLHYSALRAAVCATCLPDASLFYFFIPSVH